MVSCTECHLRIDYNVIFRFWHIVMKGAVNYATITDYDWLEEVFLPFFIPVLIFGFYVVVSDFRIR